MEDHQTLIGKIEHIGRAMHADGGFSWIHTDLADNIKAACEGAYIHFRDGSETNR